MSLVAALRLAALSALLAALFGCGKDPLSGAMASALLEAVEGAEVVEIVSLDPEPPEPPVGGGVVPAVKPGPAFHGWPFLDRSAAVSESDRAALLNDLRKMLRTPSDVAFACFTPRHAVRLKALGGDLDIVICFECLNMEIYAVPGGLPTFVSFRSANEELWNRVFRRSGITKQVFPYRPADSDI